MHALLQSRKGRATINKERTIAVIDCETDPFGLKDRKGRNIVPEPFVWGFYDGTRFVHFWGEDCTRQLMNFLYDLDVAHIIYAHNGGKFDFHFQLDYFETERLMIINGRIVKWQYRQHELRDSWAILPIPLSRYKKDKFSYRRMRREYRERYREKIVKYLGNDCRYLHELVTEFVAEFGPKLTIGSASMEQFETFHDCDRLSEHLDQDYRPFYFGGRCQAFEKGTQLGRFQVYDVNSMYPFVMKTYPHPTSAVAEVVREPDPSKPSLIQVTGTSLGAFGAKDPHGGLSFRHASGRFYVTSHEFFAALRLGLFKIDRIEKVLQFEGETFGAFVDHFYEKRQKAGREGRKAHKEFYKLILNSSYGKQGTNCAEFDKWVLVPSGEWPDDFADYQAEYKLGYEGKVLDMYHRPDPKRFGYFNVATAASITGAARAVLLEGIARATRPVYCDTDSIICEHLAQLQGSLLSDTELGAWKLEAKGERISLGGKKLYALYERDETRPSGWRCVKSASKGVKLSPEEISLVADGGSVIWESKAPTFSVRRTDARYVKRRVKNTL